MNSPLRDESENPDRDGTEKLDSAKAEAGTADGTDASASTNDSKPDVAGAAEVPVDADGPGETSVPPEANDEAGATGKGTDDGPADAAAGAGGSPDLGLVEGAGAAAEDGVRPVEFAQIGDNSANEGSGSIEMLMDIKLPISVELGRTETFVRDILEYGTGSVIELDKMAGDPVDILVNGRLVAKGEVVVVDDHFGVRITLLLTPEERVRSLG